MFEYLTVGCGLTRDLGRLVTFMCRSAAAESQRPFGVLARVVTVELRGVRGIAVNTLMMRKSRIAQIAMRMFFRRAYNLLVH